MLALWPGARPNACSATANTEASAARELWCHVDPTGFDLRFIRADGFSADMLHQFVDVLQKRREARWRSLVTGVRGNGPGQGLPSRNVELSAVHGAGNDLAVEGAEFQGRIHVSAASRKRVVGSVRIADDDLMSFKFDDLHPAGCDLFGPYCWDEFVTHDPHPSVVVEAGRPG